jgi:hypothetical protein
MAINKLKTRCKTVIHPAQLSQHPPVMQKPTKLHTLQNLRPELLTTVVQHKTLHRNVWQLRKRDMMIAQWKKLHLSHGSNNAQNS